ncbi:hypothetical protein N7450_011077 [Penicillium hetheringtonii]|uniref:Uncharacterized protein n=1 Tax=Penicillium hetheringtonii TaxID=911720 RepID=A0AAD6D9I2_9EURO|nr:hypothetical protein N7450_011077 [Penicillium hetheringtonii]
MLLNLSFPLLLACTNIIPIAIAAPSSSAYTPGNNIPEQLSTGETTQATSSIPASDRGINNYANTDRSGNDLPLEITLNGRIDPVEERIALCEAGSVGACYAAVQAGKSDTSRFTTDNLDTETSSLFPSTGVLVATFGAFCIFAMIRGSRRRDVVPQREEKKQTGI